MKFEDLKTQFDKMSAAHGYVDYDTRIQRLKTLERILTDNQDALVKAMSDDFSHRSADEARAADITITIGDIRQNIRKLKKWMKPRRTGVPKHFLPAKGRVIPQALGVVGVIAPWNFPIYLSISPAAAALAAGNQVMLKPSEITPRTSQLLHNLITETFEPEVFSVVLGDAKVGEAFSQIPFHHLFFTGSTQVGRFVAIAAAKNLTPVTLELGGKSPAIIGEHANLKRAAERIAFGKTANAGQICVSPDYALVPRAQLSEFVALFKKQIIRFFPNFVGNPDYTCIVSEKHQARIKDLISEAERNGEEVFRFEDTSQTGRCEPPVIIIDPSEENRFMREEIFGPILPIIPYDSIEDAKAYVAARPSPLALYIFSDDKDEQNDWLQNSLSGGVCVNETVFHVTADSLPFGGVGASGMGAYHGEKGFETFSHMKSVLFQSKINGMFLFNPPSSKFKRLVARLLQKII